MTLADAPMPPSEPLFGHARILARDPLRTLTRWMNEYGPIVRFRVGSREAHVVFAPDAIRRVLADPDGIYGKQTHGYQTLRLFVGDGLLTSSGGERWAQQRKVLQPAFHRQSIDRQLELMTQVAEHWRDRLLLLQHQSSTLLIDDIAMQTTLDIVGRTIFGTDLLRDANEVAESVTDLQRAANQRIGAPFVLPFSVPTPEHLRIRRARARLRKLLSRLIDQRSDHPPDAPGNAIDLLLQARDEQNRPLPRELIIDELVTLLIAGHESTANALTWALALLATHPAELAAVRAEIDADVPKLPRLKAVIDETLRLYPPAWSFGRAPTRDDVIAGHSVPAGRLVMIAPWATHRDRASFDHPEAFDPSRFLSPTKPSVPFSYLPFGAGPRTCIGAAFARTEAHVVLATWLRALDFELVAGQDLSPLPLITLRPKHGVRLRVRPRQLMT